MRIILVLIGLTITWYNIFRWVPSIITCMPAMLALSFGLTLTGIGIFIILTQQKGGRKP